ncbi:NUDIX hydrolase (plasmid) [Crocosphaera watsonii WH 8501]|uniref:NUDIX hydrolase n=1 Tax=Crocosphaera watsonii TaxID=263511 RepID=UPI003D3033E6
MNQPLMVVKAIIYQGDRLLLQLRDNKPEIYYPNYWGLFGGLMEPGELPLEAIRRELEEELGWSPPNCRFLCTWEDPTIPSMTYVFAVPLTVNISYLKLTEGQALELFTLNELTKLPIVPTVLRMLPQVISLMDCPELKAAWQDSPFFVE